MIAFVGKLLVRVLWLGTPNGFVVQTCGFGERRGK